MAENIFDSCGFAIGTIKHLYIGSRQLNGDAIEFPIEYITKAGTNDSVIAVQDFDPKVGIAVMGGQTIEISEVPNKSENIEFNEEYIEGKQGKTYVKTLNFQLPFINFNTNAALKEMIFSSNGEFAISNVIAFIIDNNDQYWVIGYDLPLILQDGMELQIAEENYYSLSFTSVSYSRVRNYEVIE